MIKVKVIENFSLGKFNELKNIVRANPRQELEGRLFKGDTFECDEEMVKYLTKTNAQGRPFVEVIEIISKEKELKRQLAHIGDAINVLEPEETEKPKRKRKTIAKRD